MQNSFIIERPKLQSLNYAILSRFDKVMLILLILLLFSSACKSVYATLQLFIFTITKSTAQSLQEFLCAKTKVETMTSSQGAKGYGYCHVHSSL
jgi:cell division protein FtsL